MNHKRKRPKNRRGGCLMCKPWKINNPKENTKHPQIVRQNQFDKADANFVPGPPRDGDMFTGFF